MCIHAHHLSFIQEPAELKTYLLMLSYLIEKEFKQLFRNSFLPRLILLFPCMLLIVFPLGSHTRSTRCPPGYY